MRDLDFPCNWLLGKSIEISLVNLRLIQLFSIILNDHFKSIFAIIQPYAQLLPFMQLEGRNSIVWEYSFSEFSLITSQSRKDVFATVTAFPDSLSESEETRSSSDGSGYPRQNSFPQHRCRDNECLCRVESSYRFRR